MEKHIRILAVDDSPVVREGLQRLLEHEEDMEVIGTIEGKKALSQVEKLSPNIVLMDIKMPGEDGIELTQQLREKFPSCKVIMLSFYDEYLPRAMEAGASGYLLKDIKGEELAQAIRYVQSGEVVISGGIPASSRLEYEQRLQDKSAGNEIFKEIQLVIPPPIDAKQATEFIQRVNEVLRSHLVHTVGSWKEGTAITVSLINSGSLADILNKLREMPEVEEVAERLPANQNLLGLLKKTAGIRLKTSPQKSILVTLKQG